MSCIELLDVDARPGKHLDRIAAAFARSHDVTVRHWTTTGSRERPDALLVFPSASPGASGRASQLTAEARARGVVTNSPGAEARWGLKDRLEDRLLRHERAGGQRVPRPDTYVVPALAAPLVVDRLRLRGKRAIIKPANGARGEGIAVDHAVESRSAALVVVQELIESPLMVDGHKVDARCYVLVNPTFWHRSRIVGPLLIRRAAFAYGRGDPAAEITNTAMRARVGLAPSVRPLELVPELATDSSRIRGGVERTIDRFLVACRTLAAPDRRRAPRVLLWGIDIGLAREGDHIWAGLLEVNVHPRLFRGDPESDRAVEQMLLDDYARELFASSRARASASSAPAR